MESNKIVDLCTRASVGLLLISGLLSLFEIGPVIEPLYQYIPAKVHILFMCSVLGTSSSILVVYLIYSILNDKLKHIYKIGLFLLIMTLISNLFLGANVIFITALVFALIMVIINVISENHEIDNSKYKTSNRVMKSKDNLTNSKVKDLNFSRISLPKLSLPKLNLSKINLPKLSLPKINLLKLELPKINLPKLSLFNKNKTSVPQSYKRYNVVRNRSPRRYHS